MIRKQVLCLFIHSFIQFKPKSSSVIVYLIFNFSFFCLASRRATTFLTFFLTIQRERQKPTKSKSTTTKTFDFSWIWHFCLVAKMRMSWQRTNSSIHSHCWQERQWFHSFFADAARPLTIWEEPRTMFVGSTRQQGATDYDEEVKTIFVYFFALFLPNIVTCQVFISLGKS